MISQRLKYYASVAPKWVPNALYCPLQSAAVRFGSSAIVEGILIADLGPSSHFPGVFESTTIEALRLIQEADPRRFRRVKREIKCIINSLLLGVGEYRRLCHTCRVDFARLYLENNYHESLREYACTLVHEATHGHIHSRYVPQYSKNYDRVERLCILEEMRFARRLGFSQAELDEIVGEQMLKRPWHEYRSMNLVQRIKRVLTRWRIKRCQRTLKRDWPQDGQSR